MAQFLSCDWGTSSFRLRLAEGRDEPRILNTFASDRGVRSFQQASGTAIPEDFAAYLCEAMATMAAPPVPVVISGMASSSIGWKELPYAIVPFPLLEPTAMECDRIDLEYHGGRLPVHLFSGVRTATDVMRGEETELAGILSLPELRPIASERCLVILPGTHSKHARIESGNMVDLTTYMTGEVFELFARKSILRASVDWESLTVTGAMADDASFSEGVIAARDRGMAASLFHVRTRDVLDGQSAAANTQFLLGLVIGEELNVLSTQDLSISIILAAGAVFAHNYHRALELLGISGDRLVCVAPEQFATATVRAHARWLDAHYPI